MCVVTWSKSDEPGFVSYGPYAHLPMGKFRWTWLHSIIKQTPPSVDIFCTNFEGDHFSKNAVKFERDQTQTTGILDISKVGCQSQVQVRVFASGDEEDFSIRYLILEKLPN
jgi:hypothetical protein